MEGAKFDDKAFSDQVAIFGENMKIPSMLFII